MRNLLLDPGLEKQPETNALLFAAQRSELARTVIRPSLESGISVVSDRSWISSAAYQGAEGIAFDDLYSINRFALGSLIRPDVCVMLDADPSQVLSRVTGESPDYFESMGDDFHSRIRENFLTTGKKMGAVVVDALQDVDTVTEQILDIINERIQL